MPMVVNKEKLPAAFKRANTGLLTFCRKFIKVSSLRSRERKILCFGSVDYIPRKEVPDRKHNEEISVVIFTTGYSPTWEQNGEPYGFCPNQIA